MASKDSNSGSGYLETLVNAANRVSAWKAVAFFEAVIIAALLWALILAVKSMPVRLIPQNFAQNNGIVEIKPDGESNAEYLVWVAESDLKLLTDWTPTSIGTQYYRLLNRMTPELYAEKNVELLGEAQQLQKSSYSQVFYPHTRRYLGPGRVQVQGQLLRYVGERMILNIIATYTVGYRFFNGLPSLAEIQFSDPQTANVAGQTPAYATRDPRTAEETPLLDSPPPSAIQAPAQTGESGLGPAPDATQPAPSVDDAPAASESQP